MPTTWLITGASSGVGRKLTEALLERGCQVAATARQPAKLDGLRERYPAALWLERLDVTDALCVGEAIAKAFDHFGRIDVIVSNAAFGLFGAAEEVSEDQIADQIDTNLTGSMRVIRAALPHLRAQGGGRILQVSSEGGQISYPNFSVYHATKWGIEGFVESVAQEVAPFGIEFTIVEPGPIRTGFGARFVTAPAMTEYEKTPSGDMRQAFAERSFTTVGDPVKIARAMIDCVAQSPAPRRLLLGREAFMQVRAALVDRLAELDAQMETAFSTDSE